MVKNDLRPLAVDLDGTLVKTDTLLELILAFIKKHFEAVLLMPIWLCRGRSSFKRKVSKRAAIDVHLLPYNKEVVDYIRRERKSGRRIVLTTASDIGVARRVAQKTMLFDEVIATDGGENIAGKVKARVLADKFGKGGFDYIGNAKGDLAVWRAAAAGLVVSNSKNLINRVSQVTGVAKVFRTPGGGIKDIARALRIHQWAKNVLLFLPLILAHRLNEISLLAATIVGFLSFSLAASAVYILNDLFDLEADRAHLIKKKRPFASGRLSIWYGILLAPSLLVAAALTALLLPGGFGRWLAVYILMNVAYSLKLKSVVMVDVVMLAVLYTVRVFAGAAAGQIIISKWFLLFILFLSLSGALAKRFAELDRLKQLGHNIAGGRGYLVSDERVIGQLGVVSGYLSVLVFAFYISSSEVNILYTNPTVLWFAVTLLLYWVSRAWLIAWRGVLEDDPVMFLLRDRVSWWVLGMAIFLVLVAM